MFGVPFLDVFGGITLPHPPANDRDARVGGKC